MSTRAPSRSSTLRALRAFPLRSLLARYLAVDDFLELLERLRAGQHAPVDEKRRRAVDADFRPGGNVGLDLRFADLLPDSDFDCSCYPRDSNRKGTATPGLFDLVDDKEITEIAEARVTP